MNENAVNTVNSANNERAKFYIEKDSMFVRVAVVFTILAAALRIIGCFGLWGDAFFATTQIVLPVLSNLLFLLCLLFLGKKFFCLTSIPVLLGAVFCIVRAVDYVWWRMLIDIILCLAGSVLYTSVAFGVVKSKWPLVPLFTVPVIYRIFAGAALLKDTVNPISLVEGLQELSILCAYIGLLFASLAMKKEKEKGKEESKLPKIKMPKIFKSEKNGEEEKAENVKPEQTAESVSEAPEAEEKPGVTPENTSVSTESEKTGESEVKETGE